MKTHRHKILIALLVILGIAGWIYLSIPAASAPLPQDTHINRIVVRKAEHTLTVYTNDTAIKTYAVSLGRGGLAPKRQEGDKKTPEGHYTIDGRNSASAFYRSLHISYPNGQDRKRAAQGKYAPGGDIMIHGLKNGTGFIGRLHLLADWTQGCIALTNEDMDGLWRAVTNGTPVEILP